MVLGGASHNPQPSALGAFQTGPPSGSSWMNMRPSLGTSEGRFSLSTFTSSSPSAPHFFSSAVSILGEHTDLPMGSF